MTDPQAEALAERVREIVTEYRADVDSETEDAALHRLALALAKTEAARATVLTPASEEPGLRAALETIRDAKRQYERCVGECMVPQAHSDDETRAEFADRLQRIARDALQAAPSAAEPDPWRGTRCAFVDDAGVRCGDTRLLHDGSWAFGHEYLAESAAEPERPASDALLRSLARVQTIYDEEAPGGWTTKGWNRFVTATLDFHLAHGPALRAALEGSAVVPEEGERT